MITKESLEISHLTERLHLCNNLALVQRTSPNDDSKTNNGIRRVDPALFLDRGNGLDGRARRCRSCPSTAPSIDRIFDNGKLLNHRRFWSVEPESFETNPNTRIGSTITELAYIPKPGLPDGHYLLDPSIAPFDSDLRNSCPVLLPYLQ